MRFALAVTLGLAASQLAADGHNCPHLLSDLRTPKVSEGTNTVDGGWAVYVGPTEKYAHGILGDAIEAEGILYQMEPSHFDVSGYIPAGAGHVFEDTEPRFSDVNLDGRLDIVAVRSSFTLGSQLIVYDSDWACPGPFVIASTPYIGQANRWLAPIGAADLDRDGTVEIAYIDRPHLAKTLRIVSLQGDQLVEKASIAGFTNHRIGERDIAGGVRDCGQGPEMIVATADWSQLIAITYDGNFTAREIGTDTSRAAFAQAMACQ